MTSRLLYDDVAERPITDVDIRIRPRDFPRFRSMAAAAGWRCVRVARSYGNLIYDFGALSLDVEAYVGPPGLCSLRVQTMLDRCERLHASDGLEVFVPELHDHAVLLTVNAFKDKMVTAPSYAIEDLKRIVREPHFRPEIFVERVRQAHVATVTWIVASWMESAWQSHIWGDIRARIESCAEVRRVYARLFQRKLATAQQAPMSLRLLARAGADSPLMQARALLGALAWTGEMALRRAATRAGTGS